MLDPKHLRKNPEVVAEQLARRGFIFDVGHFKNLETKRKTLQQQTERLQAERNHCSKQIGELKQQDKDIAPATQEVKQLGEKLAKRKQQLQALQQELRQFLEELPNVPHQSVPGGTSEEDNQEVSRWGEPREFDFMVNDHVDLAESRGWLDFASASQLATARFSVLRGDLAMLHRALAQMMLEYHVREYDYEEINVPFIVNGTTLFGTGQLPKFEEDLFLVRRGDLDAKSERQLYLIPTAEVPLTNLVANKIIDLQELPHRYVAHTPCFRSEAGNSGRDIKGLIRQHQFEKVELVNICTADQSWQCLEDMVTQAQEILELLELPYRKIKLCTGDMGFSATFTYDLEVWLPSQHTYREISSISNCLDFQARRMQARTKNAQGETMFVHTLNGSGVAVGRALLALLENHQQSDGRIVIPVALRPYVGGAEVL